jgi:myo-inositol-1(or 4)-monophosphatase
MSEVLLGVAVEAARAAAELVRSRSRAEVTVAATKSSDVDVVTEADRSAERLIRERIGTSRPHDAILGEEGDDVPGTSGVRWVIDPIDGTVNFLYGLPQYAVSVAAEVDGEIVAGVVLNIATGTEFTAHVDESGVTRSHRDGEPIRVRETVPLGQRLVSTGFGYDARLRELQARALVNLLPRVRDIRRLGSCALDLCHVAEGTLDGYVEEGVNLWDHAAGGLVAQGAGAVVEVTTGAGGGRLVLCAPADGFAELRMLVGASGYLAGWLDGGPEPARGERE